tara:strand:- start:733 stop:1383 length:651 start_codon:yes stop_codon:yes gene_type:complete
MKIQEFDYSVNILKSLLWRHNKAENLEALIQDKQNAFDVLHGEFWDNWFTDVFNLQTANEFGLSVWSIILNLPLSIEPQVDKKNNGNFGFGSFRKNFNNGNFTNAVDVIVLSPETARIALRLRYYQLVTRGTIPECNGIIKDVFGGNNYVLDGLDMTMTYVFNESIPSDVRTALDYYDLLPRPSAVRLKKVYSPNSGFGFGGFRKNFNNGNFRSGA